MSHFFIDFEGFQDKSGSEYIIKELAIIELHHPYDYLHWVFKPTKPWRDFTEKDKKSNAFLINHHHGIDYNEGATRFCSGCVMHQIEQKYPDCNRSVFYIMEGVVNGIKVQTLKRLFPKLNVVNYNINMKNLPVLQSNIRCPHRDHGYHCAYLKCVGLIQHYLHFM